jgi:hypothetical protein
MEGHDVVGTTGSFFLKNMPDTAARSSITCAACGQRHPPPPQ